MTTRYQLFDLTLFFSRNLLSRSVSIHPELSISITVIKTRSICIQPQLGLALQTLIIYILSHTHTISHFSRLKTVSMNRLVIAINIHHVIRFIPVACYVVVFRLFFNYRICLNRLKL